MRTVFLYAHFDDGHELAVVLKVGIALALDIAFEQFAGYFGAATQFYVVFQPFGEVEVSADEAYEFVFEPFHFGSKGSILSNQLFAVGFGLFLAFCHSQMYW